MTHADIKRLLFTTGALTHRPGSDLLTINPSRLTLDPKGAAAVATQLLTLMQEHRATHIGGTADGGIPIISHAVLLSALSRDPKRPLRGFYHTSVLKDHGLVTNINGHPPSHGQRTAMVTDLATTGHSLLQSAHAATAAGADVAFTFAIIEHGPVARAAIERAGYQFITVHKL